MTKRWTWMALVLIAMAALWGCSDDDDPVTPSTQTAYEAMVEAGAAYINDSADCPGVISAAALHANGVENYKIFDIRATDAFVAGHIPGAIDASLGNILADVAANATTSDNIIIACYSGQSAGHAKIALELMGYENVQSLLFGMSSWSHATAGSWNNNTGNVLAAAEQTNNNATLTTHAAPTLSEDVSTVVADRVNAMLAAGFKAISFGDMTNLDDYFIMNYFGEADYLGTGTAGVPGHIPGAFQFTPYSSLGVDEMLENLPTDKPIVVYCWTGQHSSQITAYLNMLGYEAYSLKFGSNALFHDELTAHKWTAAAMNDFEMEYGSAPTADFAAMAAAGVAYVNDSADCPGVISAATLNTNGVDNYKIFDTRKPEHYNPGHIQGAINTSLSTLLTDVAANATLTDDIVIACYSGQTAGHAKIALELMGYENVQSLLFGMSAWNTTLAGSWNDNTANNLATYDTVNNNGDLVGHAFPELTGTVEDRVNAMLAGGFKGIKFSDMTNLDDFFIMNYFGEADYMGTGTAGVPGHIPGAFQFTPYATMDVDQMLAFLPTDMPIVVYCWTGQHSSQITAYLNMLGYDAYSLKFGSNNLFYDQLTAHKWSAGAQNDFPLFTD
jgi:rhodanese-related sulfurtransferase